MVLTAKESWDVPCSELLCSGHISAWVETTQKDPQLLWRSLSSTPSCCTFGKVWRIQTEVVMDVYHSQESSLGSENKICF